MADNRGEEKGIPLPDHHLFVLANTLLPSELGSGGRVGELSDSDISTIPETPSSTADSELIHGVSPILKSYVPDSPAANHTPTDHSQQNKSTYSTIESLPDDTSFFDVSQINETQIKPCFQCGTCGKILKNKGSLNLHVRRHTKDFNFTCELCGESFLINQQLKEHIAKVHKKTGVVKCKVCGKITSTFRGMREHVKEHAGEEHKCSECDKSFPTKNKLQRHLSWHSKEFECSVCEKWFATKGQLKIHSLMHDEHAQKYQCSQCDYVSVWKASVNRHVKTKHNDIRHHICEKCGGAFKEKSALTRHMQRSTCDRPRASNMWEEL